MNVFGGFFHIGSSAATEKSFLAARDFFESSFHQVSMKRIDAFACWSGIVGKSADVQSSVMIHESSCGRYLLTGSFRLDYRDDLGDKLGIRYADLMGMQDSQIVLLAFEKWKFEFKLHLEGDWSTVIYDKKDKDLFMFRDPIGAGVVFYVQNQDGLFFSLDPRFFDSLGIPLSVDLGQFYRLGLKSGKVEDGKTVIKEILTLKIGQVIMYNGRLTEIDKSVLISSENVYKFKNDDDYIAHFKSTYAAAVRTRLRNGKIGLLLSAGLDSSMLCYFAAREQSIKALRLNTFTSFPKHIHLFTPLKQSLIREDLPVKKFLKQFKNVDSALCDFKDVDIMNIFKNQDPVYMLTSLINPNTFWIQGFYSNAKAGGLNTMLVAKMSNYTVSWDAPNIGLSYLMRLELVRLYIFLKELSKGKILIWLKSIKTELIMPLSSEFKFFFNRLIFIFSGFTVSQSVVQKKRFTRVSYGEVNFKFQFYPDYNSRFDSKRVRFSIVNSMLNTAGINSVLDGLKHNLEITDPSADIRLIKLSFSYPERIFNQQGDRKFLYKKIMTGIVEEEALNKRVPFPQAYDIGLRLLESPLIKKEIQAICKDKNSQHYLRVDLLENFYNLLKKRCLDRFGVLMSVKIIKIFSLALILRKFQITK